MAVLGGVGAVGTSILADVAVRLGVTLEHRPVDAGVVAARAAERLGADVIAQVVLKVVLELGNERTFRTRQHPVASNVHATVDPELLLYHKHVHCPRFYNECTQYVAVLVPNRPYR